MNTDPDAVSRKILDAFERARPRGPFLGYAPGARIEVGLDGMVVDLAFDREIYRASDSDDLGAAIVLAHRQAREAAIASQHQAILDALEAMADRRFEVGAPRKTAGQGSPDHSCTTKADLARQYADRIGAGRLAVGGDGVTVVMCLDGFLERVYIAASIRQEHPPSEVAWLVLLTIRKADRAAEKRRRELARQLIAG